jgi:hypothetical protein
MGVLMSLLAERHQRSQRAIAIYRSEKALRATEALYRTLFNSMEEGFCVIEVIFDANQTPLDYRFLEANPAFKKQTGMPNPVGRTMREFAPDLEDYWCQLFGNVALTGEPAHFLNEAKAIRCAPSIVRPLHNGWESTQVKVPANSQAENASAPERRADFVHMRSVGAQRLVQLVAAHAELF